MSRNLAKMCVNPPQEAAESDASLTAPVMGPIVDISDEEIDEEEDRDEEEEESPTSPGGSPQILNWDNPNDERYDPVAEP